MVHHGDEAGAVGLLEGLGKRRTIARRAIATVHERDRIECGGVAYRRHPCRLVDQRHLDGIGAEGVGLARGRVRIDERVRVGTRLRIELRHEMGNGARGAVAVVLDFHDAQHVGVQTHQRRDRLRHLTVEFRLTIGAAAIRRAATHTVVQPLNELK